MVSARRRTFTWSKPVVPTSAIGPRDDTTTIPPLKCDECAVELKGDVWVLRELVARRSGGRRGTNDPRSRRTLTVCETCWGRLARSVGTVDLPCGVCGRIRHCDASSGFGARFQALHACSAECAGTARRGPVRIVITLRCRWCGEAFTAIRRGARYCSAAHRKAAHHQAGNST